MELDAPKIKVCGTRRFSAETMSFAVFIFFMAVGARAVSFGSDTLSSQIFGLVSDELSLRTQQPFLLILLNIFICRAIDFAVIFLSGLAVFGFVVSYAWLGFSGLKLGLISGGLYKIGGLAGFGCFAAVLMPFALATLFINIIMNAQSSRYSAKLFFSSFRRPCIDAPRDIKLYILRSAVLFAALCCCSAAESAAGALLTGLFGINC